MPPPPTNFLQRIGRGFASAVDNASNASLMFAGQSEAEVSSEMRKCLMRFALRDLEACRRSPYSTCNPCASDWKLDL